MLLPETSENLQTVARAVAEGRKVPPVAFGTYFQVAESLMGGELDDAAYWSRELAALPERAPGLACSIYGATEAEPLTRMLELGEARRGASSRRCHGQRRKRSLLSFGKAWP